MTFSKANRDLQRLGIKLGHGLNQLEGIGPSGLLLAVVTPQIQGSILFFDKQLGTCHPKPLLEIIHS